MNRAAMFLRISALAVLPFGAFAQDEKSSPMPSHLPLRTEACFGRVYDPAHLSAHPRQRVTAFHIAREFKADPNSEYEPTPESEARNADGSDGRISVTAYVRFRDRKGVYANGLSCWKTDGAKVLCGIDCDGGSFALRPAGQSLLLDNNGFVVVGGCGASEDEQENEEHVLPGADDRTFRLDPKPFAACMAERDAMAPAFAKLGAPLRARFRDSETLCLSRTYETAHLAAHPKQSVRRIAVLKTKESRSDPDLPFYNLTFRIELRDGKTFEQKAGCYPDRYALACRPDVPMDEDRYFYLSRAANGGAMLRDKHGLLEKLFATRLGTDDRVFRLGASATESCRF